MTKKNKRTTLGKLKDNSFTCEIQLDDTMTNKMVEEELTHNIAYLIFMKKNVVLGVDQYNKVINMVGYSNIKDGRKMYGFKNTRKVDMEDVIEIYKKNKDIDDAELKQIEKNEIIELICIAEQIVNFVMVYWLRNGTMAYLFIYNSLNSELEVGLGIDTDMKIMAKIDSSIHQYKNNKDGIFLKRQWILKEELDKTQGSGKK